MNLKLKTLKTAVITIYAMIFIASCAPSTSIIVSWKDPEVVSPTNNYASVFVAALSSNMTARTKLESAIALQAERNGFKASKSIDYFSQTFTKDNAPTKDQILEKVKAANIDAILTVALVNKEKETRYVPGTTTMYSPYSYGYYGRFGGYYGAMYPTMYDPGYYTTDKTYYIETNLYRTSDEKLIWSAQSKTVNPNGLDDFINGYLKALGKKLQSDGLVVSKK